MSDTEPTQTNEPMTPEQQAEFLEKQKEFLKEYGELVEKHQIDFAQYPVYLPNPSDPGSFKTVIHVTPVSVKGVPRKSPFVQQ